MKNVRESIHKIKFLTKQIDDLMTKDVKDITSTKALLFALKIKRNEYRLQLSIEIENAIDQGIINNNI